MLTFGLDCGSHARSLFLRGVAAKMILGGVDKNTGGKNFDAGDVILENMLVVETTTEMRPKNTEQKSQVQVQGELFGGQHSLHLIDVEFRPLKRLLRGITAVPSTRRTWKSRSMFLLLWGTVFAFDQQPVCVARSVMRNMEACSPRMFFVANSPSPHRWPTGHVGWSLYDVCKKGG